MNLEVLDAKAGDYTPFEPTTRQELLDRFDHFVTEARAAIASASDEDFNKIWSMKWEGKTVMTMPRITVLRTVVLNHLIHHRAQISVYLRLMNEKVPGMYGASADEPEFGMTEEAA
jgi:uncharacterized damage-inducible protein DinB